MHTWHFALNFPPTPPRRRLRGCGSRQASLVAVLVLDDDQLRRGMEYPQCVEYPQYVRLPEMVTERPRQCRAFALARFPHIRTYFYQSSVFCFLQWQDICFIFQFIPLIDHRYSPQTLLDTTLYRDRTSVPIIC